jgi:UDP-galactopyranose mutase
MSHGAVGSKFPPKPQTVSRLSTPSGKFGTSDRDVPDFFPKISSLVAFSHLRWDFVFQRPHHLLTRFARDHEVFYIEEPLFDGERPHLESRTKMPGLTVVTPHLPLGISESEAHSLLSDLLHSCRSSLRLDDSVHWFYTPMALNFTRHFQPRGIVYDCMDELSLFKDAHPALPILEKELFEKADIVFTGGYSLFEHKKSSHRNIHPFPSSIDAAHFAQARLPAAQRPIDQAAISGKKIGFFGVIDERMDILILDGIARARPNWSLILLGPVLKIDPATLPRHPNLHYLGAKHYSELPAYLADWDVAILPFAKNPSTRFISPTKTPEYLAAGKPVVSTSIRDVVYPYKKEGLVAIADTSESFVEEIESILNRSSSERDQWLKQVDRFLENHSWDKTWTQMSQLMYQSVLTSQLNSEGGERQLLRRAQ